MAGDTPITIVGNLTGDPELRYTPNGAAVANFTVASTPRRFDRQSNEWKDEETLFMRCNVWRDAAENVAESLTRGMRVIVQGKLQARSYEKDGEKRYVTELLVDEVGPSLARATAKVAKTERTGGQHSGQQSGGWGQQGDDPWATNPGAAKQGQVVPGSQGPQASPGAAGGWGGSGVYDEPPF